MSRKEIRMSASIWAEGGSGKLELVEIQFQTKVVDGEIATGPQSRHLLHALEQAIDDVAWKVVV